MYIFEVKPDQVMDRLFVPLYRARHVILDLEMKGRVAVPTLGEIAEVNSGTYVRGYTNEGLLYLRVDNVREFICNVNKEDLVRVSSSAPGITDRVIVKEGDVLIARTGTLGKAAICFGPTKGAVMSQHLTRITAMNPDKLYPGYLAAFLNSDLGKYQLIYSGYGSTRQELTHSALKAIKIPLAPTKVQEDIHDIAMDGVARMYRSMAQYDSALQDLEQFMGLAEIPITAQNSFFIFGEHLGPMWTPRFYKPEYVSLVNWLVSIYMCRGLGTIAKIQRGKGTRVSDYATKGIPFVRTTSLINYGIDPFPDHYASEDIHELFQQPVKEGDILFSIEGKIGQAAYLTNEDICVFKNHIELIECDEALDPMYIFLVLSTRIGKFQAFRNTVVQATLPGMAGRLRDFLIPIEPKDQKQCRGFKEKIGAIMRCCYGAAAERAAGTRRLREAAQRVDEVLGELAR